MAKKTAAKKLLDMFFQEGEYDPRYSMRKLDPIEGKPVVEQRQVIPENLITLEQLEGTPYLTTMSDRTAAGGLLTGFGDKQLGYPVNLTGGQDFMRDFTQNPNLWASGDTVVPKMVNAARELEAEYGKAPVLMPWRMAPTGSDFAGMTGKTMLSYAAGNMPATFKKEVDGFMKLYVPDWKGVDNPASGAQFDALPDGTRKQVQQQLDKLFRNKGGTTLPQARLAIADQTQLNAPVGGFQNVGLIDTSQDALRGAGNTTYPSALAGDYVGTLDTDVTAIDLNPARYARARNPDGSFVEGPEGKDLLSTKTAPRRSMEVNYYGGLLDDKLLRDLEDRGFKVKSGVLPTLTTLGVAAQGLLGSEEADAAIVPSALKSIALDAMADVPRKKPTSYTGWKKALNKAGIKDDELKQMGFDREFEFRQKSQDITRKEVEDFLRENQYNIREEVLGQSKVFGEVKYDPELNTYNAVMPDSRDDDVFHTREFAERYVQNNPRILNDAQYGPYTLTGGDNVNYREILLMDGPEADKYEALTKQINKLESEIEDAIGVDKGYLTDAIIDAGYAKGYDRLQELRAERNSLPQPYIHQHFDEKENILTHMRVADRDLEDGSSTLMVEEIQSDLHQRGQEYGYAKPNALEDINAQIDAVDKQLSGLKQTSVSLWAAENMPDVYKRAYGSEGDLTSDEFAALRKKMVNAFEEDYKKRTGKDRNEEFERLADLRDSLKERRLKAMQGVPDMPFKSDDKSSWYDLGFKRSLIEAANGDYDSISFTTGQQQVDRYGESAAGGVKKFYDVTLPNHINKWAKQYGAKLERKPIRVGEKDYSVDTYDDGSYFVRNEEGGIIEDFDSLEEAEAYIKKHHEIQDVYTLKIPEKMRKDIREKGMPLFAQTGLMIGGATTASGLLSTDAQADDDSSSLRESNRAAIEKMLAEDAKKRKKEELEETILGILDAPAAAGRFVDDALTNTVGGLLQFPLEMGVRAVEKAVPALNDSGIGDSFAENFKSLYYREPRSRKDELIRNKVSDNLTSAVESAMPFLRSAYTHKGLIGGPSIQDIVQATQKGYQALPEGYLKDNALPAAGLTALGLLGAYDALGLRRKVAQTAQETMMPQGLLN